nr:ATP-binding protein [Paenibacillus sp. UNC451MF]
MTRDVLLELDELKQQMNDLQKLVRQQLSIGETGRMGTISNEQDNEGTSSEGMIYYSGQYRNETLKYKWEAHEQQVSALLTQDGEKLAKILSALGNKQRLDILRSVLKGPASGNDLVEQLHMGTTGQLYHHMKALIGSDLLIQEERGGDYSLPPHRVLPVLLLLAAANELADTSGYLDMVEAREHAERYLGKDVQSYDPHVLVWALLENSILEHQAGYCTEVDIIVHAGSMVTVADNGRGIPVSVLSNSSKPNVQTVLTDIQRPSLSAPFFAPGGEKGISVAVVNALSHKLSVEIRREGSIFRQDYKHGIPQTGVMSVGSTKETGTSITLEPEHELFNIPFEIQQLEKRASEVSKAYPNLHIRVHPIN